MLYDFTLPSWRTLGRMCHVRAFKVGGLRFLRIGRLQVSWCICRRKPELVIDLEELLGPELVAYATIGSVR